MRIARWIFSRYNNLIFAVLEVRWRAYYNMVLNFVEVFALIYRIGLPILSGGLEIVDNIVPLTKALGHQKRWGTTSYDA